MTDDLELLAERVRRKNEADREIAEQIGRPCAPGNIGEYVAAKVFGIRLEPSGAHPGFDGRFEAGPLAGKTVNIKAYGRHESVLDISAHHCDCYLVLAGPPGQARIRPWVIESVFLFDTAQLLSQLKERRVKIGVATSVPKAAWEAARVFPPGPASPLPLTERQIALLALFAPGQ